LVVVPLDADKLYAETLAPGVKAAGLEPAPARPASTAKGLELLRVQVHTATAILADIRREDPFCFTVLGIAAAVTDRLVVVTDDASNVPYALEPGQVIVRPDELRSESDFKELTTAITEHLIALPSGGESEQEDKLAPMQRVTELSRSLVESDALINALWADGLSVASIRIELLQAGAPRSWLELRLARLRPPRRPGW
jgi:hypothetical protein